jgi:hypothetical protein
MSSLLYYWPLTVHCYKLQYRGGTTTWFLPCRRAMTFPTSVYACTWVVQCGWVDFSVFTASKDNWGPQSALESGNGPSAGFPFKSSIQSSRNVVPSLVSISFKFVRGLVLGGLLFHEHVQSRPAILLPQFLVCRTSEAYALQYGSSVYQFGSLWCGTNWRYF